MATVTTSATLGRPFFEGTSALRSKDDASDNKSGGVYSHNALEFSATEAGEWQSLFMFITQLLAGGTAALKCRNMTGSTITKGTLVYISGYNATYDRLLIAPAAYDDATKPALFVLDADIATGANGTVYGAALVTGLDTSAASAVGDPVYAGADGAWTLTAPTDGSQIVQEVGRVTIKDASGGAIAFYAGARFIQRLNSGMLPP